VTNAAAASRSELPLLEVPLLEVTDLRAGFGSITVLHGLSFSVQPGEIAGIFGLNGAGKSVAMKVLAGVVPVRSGSIRFAGEDVTNVAAERRVRLGMGHVPQGRQVFPELTVEENLRLGAYTLRRKDKSRYAPALAGVYDRFPLLAERRGQQAGTLSGGQQSSLAVARALINEPTLILVDEPSAGLAPLVVEELFHTLRAVAQTGVTMVLVEQNVTFGLQLADRAHILQVGRIVYSGEVGTLDQQALAGYLGIGRMLGGVTAGALASRRRAPAKKAAAKKRTAAKKAPATKPAAEKTVAKKTPATRGTATRKAAPAKKTPRRKSP
jgi:branched-chain amino acid transport system ATP-binding protein